MAKNKKLIIWSAVILVLVIIAVFLIVGYAKLTKDVLPAAPVNYTDPKTLGTSIASDVLLNNKAVLTEEDFNGALYQAKESINASMNEKKSNFVIQDLFGEIRETDVVIYCRAVVNNFPVYATAEANLQFISPDVEIVVKTVKIGDIKIPGRWVTGFLQDKTLPDNLSVTGDRICYDTSSLNSLIIETARQNETVAKVEAFVVGIAEFFHQKFDTEEFVDFQIKDVTVENGSIVIKTSIF